MIPSAVLFLAAAVAPVGPPNPHPSQARFEACVKQSDADPAAAIATAQAWLNANGGILAGQCLGVAYSAAGAWTSATKAFSDAATMAVERRDGRAGDLWVSAGNAALAGGDASRAKAALTSALNLPVLDDPMRGEALLDRARASVSLDDLPGARTDMEAALKLVPGDPMAWLLSATLARRMDDKPRAAADIREAEQRAPGEPNILYEAGNIAAAAGDIPSARQNWSRAQSADPQGEAGQAAARELTATGGSYVAMPAATAPVGR